MLLRTLCQSLRQLKIAEHQACLVRHSTYKVKPITSVIGGLVRHSTHDMKPITSVIGGSIANHARYLHTTAAAGAKLRFIPFGETGEQKYTIRPLPTVRYSGRDLETGRIVKKRCGGGQSQRYRMLDYTREPPEDGSVYEEKILDILYDPNRTARIALVAGGNHKRYIIATVNMKKGDIIKTSGQVSRLSVSANEGDAYRLASLPIGQLVHGIPKYPGDHGRFCRAAGTSGQIVRKIGGMVVIQLPSKRQISVNDQCMVTIGKVSNEDHNKTIIGKAGRNRWKGIRPKSGLFQRKTGRHGRKIKPLPPIQVFLDKKSEGTQIPV